MADFLLIHGSGHGAWCWRDVIPALGALGHRAQAIDLPGHGDDPTPVAEVTLEGYRDAVLAASTPDTIVVGHSMGGYPIAAAAEADPGAMRRLVFLCAYAPVNGLSLGEMRRLAPRQPLLPAIRRAPDGLSFTFNPDMVRELFYHDCPDEAVAYATPRLCVQAVRPQETPITLSAAYASVPKSYIICSNDHAIPPEYQAHMCRDFPPEDVTTMPVSHSPFLADPEGLAQRLSRIAEAG